jgi:hypothetical protein
VTRLTGAGRRLALGGAAALLAHDAPAIQTACEPDPPPSPVFHLFRYDEDYRALADPLLRTGPFDAIKHLPLSAYDPDAYLSLGGEVRLQYESYRPPDLGTGSARVDDYLLTRVELHADAHWSRSVRTFVELIDGRSLGEEVEAPASQENGVELQQAFAEYADAGVSVRAGRMEMGYGSFRLVAPREGTNLRANYDGVRVGLRNDGGSLDAFVTRPVRQETGAFDDAADDTRAFWGLYGVVVLDPRSAAGFAYYLGLRDERAEYGTATGDEERHSGGVRLWGAPGRFDYDLEALGQFGRFDGRDIRAWTCASSCGLRLGDASDAPRLGLKANVASGDRNADDGELETFDPLFPRNSYFSEAALVAPSNFWDVQPLVQLFPSRATTITLAADAFFRFSEDDAVYAPGGPVIAGGVGGSGLVGTTASVQAEWILGANVDLSASFVHFQAGDVVRDAGGESVDFATVSLAFRF